MARGEKKTGWLSPGFCAPRGGEEAGCGGGTCMRVCVSVCVRVCVGVCRCVCVCVSVCEHVVGVGGQVGGCLRVY